MQSNAAKQNEKRPIYLAAGFGLLAAVLVVLLLRSSDEETPLAPVFPTTNAVIALTDLPPGTRITAEMVELRELPEAAVALDAFTSVSAVSGMTVRYPISPGEQITPGRLVEGQRVRALSFQIPPGMRAMTIPISSQVAPGALAAPGDFVDLLISVDDHSVLSGTDPLIPGQPTPQAGRGAVATLLQNVQVLSVGSAFADNGLVYDSDVRGEARGDSVNYVTLAVTPQQAQLLWHVHWHVERQGEAQYTLVLRAFGDDEIVPLQPRSEPLLQP